MRSCSLALFSHILDSPVNLTTSNTPPLIQKADLKLTICKSGLQNPRKEVKYRLIVFTLDGSLDWQEGLHDLISLCGDSMSKIFVPHRRSEGSVC